MSAELDPARWPFDEARARERAALVAYPDPPIRTVTRKRLANPNRARRSWEAKRAAEREAAGDPVGTRCPQAAATKVN